MTSARTKARSYRRWSPEERRAIALESFGPDTTVTAIAKKHGVSAVSLYLWRKEFGSGSRPSDAAGDRSFGGAGGQGLLPHAPAGSVDEDTETDGASGPGSVVVRNDDHRIRELEQQLAKLQAELLASKRQRALLVSVLTSIGSQLKLLVEMEDSSYLSGPDLG